MARAWAPPAQVEEYRLVRELGAGAMGTVWLAHDQSLDRSVAIKFIAAAAPDASAKARFLNEARAVARLHHPNVATAFRVGEADGRPYLVSEYVRGRPLSEVVRVGQLAPDEVVRVVLGLTCGLAAAHRRGVVHRDVKPSNAVLGEDGEVKLVDFGLAKLLDADVEAEPAAPASVPAGGSDDSEPGHFKGTPHYLAPETWTGAPPSATTDVYSLGATLYHLVVGRVPHTATDVRALARKALTQAPAAPHAARPETPEWLSDVILRCLERDPSQRFATAEAVREALESGARARVAASLPPGNPYRGLHAFGAEHRQIFFGRDLEIGDVIERLRAEAWVVVAGRSGAGKSSLVRAGILPRIVDDGALRVRGGPQAWRAVTLVPGARPRAALVTACAPLVGGDEARLAAALDADPAALARELRRSESDGTILFVDQLEELVTLSEPGELDRFVDVLRELVAPSRGVRVLCTVRSDFIGHFAAFGDWHHEFARALYVLGPMTSEGVRDAVVAPAAAHAVRFESDDDVAALVAAVAADQGSLPLLEFALAKLWDARDAERAVIPRDALDGIGGVAGALAQHADGIVASLAAGARAEARRILVRLVSADGTRARRSEAELGDVSAGALDALVRGRLLTLSDDGTVEVAHEALLTGWKRLSLWLEEEKGVRRAREALEVAAADWERLGRPHEALWRGRRLDELALLAGADLGARERAFADASRRADRRARWRRRLALVAGPTLVFGTILGVQAWNHHVELGQAERKTARAAEALRRARDLRDEGEGLRRRALAEFEAGRDASGRILWRDVVARTAAVDEAYDEAFAPISEALSALAGYAPARRLAAELFADRVALAEAAGRDVAPVARQVRLYDDERRFAAWLEGDGSLAVTSDPPGAEVTLYRYVDRDGDGRFVEERVAALGPTPVARAPRQMGSYLLVLSLPGREPARLPLQIGRQEEAIAAVRLLPAGRVPPGFVYVPAGRSLVGTTDPNLVISGAVRPARDVVVDGFLIARLETTFADWMEWLAALPPAERAERLRKSSWMLAEAGGRLGFDPANAGGTGRLEVGEPFKYYVVDRGRNMDSDWRRWPMGRVTRLEAEAYARWRGARLCREVEWERATRGADGRRFPHGARIYPDDATYGETYGATHRSTRFFDEVGLFPRSASPFGVLDLVGGVYEWTADTVDEGIGVVKGGGYMSVGEFILPENRTLMGIETVSRDVGLRLCIAQP